MSFPDHTQTGRRRSFFSSSLGLFTGRRRNRTRHLVLESLESRQLLSTTITEYPTPNLGSSPGVSAIPTEIVAAGGKLWFTEFGNAIGSLDPTTSPPTITSYSQGLPSGSGPQSITVGPGGKLWFTELFGGQIGTIDPANPGNGIQNYGPAQGMPANARPFGITTDANGNVWFTDLANNALGKLNPSTGAITETKLPNTLVGFATFNSVITAGPGGKLYFTETQFGSGNTIAASGIGIYNPSGGSFSEVRLPSGSNQEPFGLTVGPDQNIWFSEGVPSTTVPGTFQSSSLGLIVNPSSASPTLKQPSSLSVSGSTQPYRLTTGPDGNIWFTLPSAHQIGVVQVQSDPANDTISTLSVPTTVIASPLPSGIIAGPDGNIWFTDTSGAIGKAVLDTNVAMAVQPPQSPATATAGDPFGITAKIVYSDTGVVNKTYNGVVTASLNGSGTLGGTTSVTAVNGVAQFTNLIVSPAGTGYSLTLSAAGTASATTSTFNVTNPVLHVYSQPTGSLNPGSPFTVVVYTTTAAGVSDPAFSGSVTLQLASNPGGSTLSGQTTVTASGGVATFSNLSLNNPGAGYTLTASGAGLTPVTTAPFTISAPAPTIQSATVLMHQNTNKRGKPMGRPVLVGYQLTFDSAMSASVFNANNYQVDALAKVRVRVKVGKRFVIRMQLQPRPIAFSVNYVAASNAVQILTGRQTFPVGGQITLGTGISDLAGGFLGSGAVYNIAPRGLRIGHA